MDDRLLFKCHLGESGWAGDDDIEEVGDGQVEQEAIGERAQGWGPEDGRDHQQGILRIMMMTLKMMMIIKKVMMMAAVITSKGPMEARRMMGT